MKKFIALLLVLALSLSLVFANEDYNEDKNGFNFSVATGAYTTGFNFSGDVGRWEFGGTLASGFPNICIITSVQNIINKDFTWDTFKDSLASSFIVVGAEGKASFDVIKNPKHDLDLGVSVGGLFCPLMAIFNIAPVMGYAGVNLKYTLNLHGNGGLMIETGLPLCFILPSSEKKVEFASVFQKDGASLLLTCPMLFTRIGYTFKF